MQVPDHLLRYFIIAALSYALLLPIVSCSSDGEVVSHTNIRENVHKVSPQMTSHIAVHGLFLWVSMGFLMPVGVLTIRMANKEEGGTRVKVLFYLHGVLQTLAVLLATVGAIMSIKNLENSFNNNHQRLGLALYGAIWMQALVGFLRPPREGKRRSTWYITHWILGTTTSTVGIINIYTGLEAYHKKTSKGTGIWTILFTAQVSFMALLYLFQDKWEHIQKQGLMLPNLHSQANQQQQTLSSDHREDAVIVVTQRVNQKVLLPEPCSKSNALRNLFD
ncbi:cytochrome b561 domain-containing protein At4g18260-like [Hibiscus syriacus]|uniref:cytochrome b561 domain-containing protein At4g18260-like n=1 Tax=Hibiscus syriacus TaxID=106335 RepID=UPI001922E186|nr:cytochrome b561 domain-containing protein At4g18260-like [Hibiscus syriacus]